MSFILLPLSCIILQTYVLSFFTIRIARNNNQKSGTHDDFHNFIMGCPWILFYHERMEELGDHSSLYLNIAYPSLAESVFMTSDGVTEAPGSQTGGGLESKGC
jgi:hypothetical protein